MNEDVPGARLNALLTEQVAYLSLPDPTEEQRTDHGRTLIALVEDTLASAEAVETVTSLVLYAAQWFVRVMEPTGLDPIDVLRQVGISFQRGADESPPELQQ